MRSISHRGASSLLGERIDAEILRRPRIVDRFAKASERRIVLVSASAGYGKTVALQQFLRNHSGETIAVDVTRDAFDASRIPERFGGIVVIDGFERASTARARTLVSCIESERPSARWIIATRAVDALPVGTWLARRDCEIPIGVSDLRFTEDEIAQACRMADVACEPDDVGELAALTEGWPVAVSIALRALKHGMSKRDVRTFVRETLTDYLREEVYPAIGDRERELLEVATALPEIDVGVLEIAGFPDALQTLEATRRRTGLLYEEDRRFTTSTLVRDFFRRQTALAGNRRHVAVNLRAAQALETAGQMEAALVAYAAARSQPNLLRLLEASGFDLLERGRSECVSNAVEALDEPTRRTNPRILALRGVLQSLAGKPIRAEALLRRSIAHAKNDRDLFGFASLRMAPLAANYGGDVGEALRPIAADQLQLPSIRAEALSLLAVTYGMSGDKDAARHATEETRNLLVDVDRESTRAKALQRIGVAAMYTGENEKARQLLIQAGDLANELDMNGVASRAWSALSNLMCHAYDDVMSQLWYAERAADAAMRSGDSLEMQTALLQVAAAEMRRGNAEESAALEEQLTNIRSDPRRAHLMAAFKALRLAWDGKFARAHETLCSCWDRMYHEFDRILCGAQCALFLALDGRRDSSVTLIERVRTLAEVSRPGGLFPTRCIALALLLCVVAEMANQRLTAARKLARRIRAEAQDEVVFLASRLAEHYTRDSGALHQREIVVGYERLRYFGYADIVQVLESASAAFESGSDDKIVSPLTLSEIAILHLLGDGLSTKEIAARDGRSVYTVRAHIANAIAKLRCRGRTQALATARRLQIIP